MNFLVRCVRRRFGKASGGLARLSGQCETLEMQLGSVYSAESFIVLLQIGSEAVKLHGCES